MNSSHDGALSHAVQYLYGKGTINKDKDIAERTGYNKATVSSYISGRTKPSADFLHKFESVFHLKLIDFEAGGKKEVIKHPDALQLISENVLLLKAELQTNRQLVIEVLAAVTNRSVTEVELIADKILSHSLEKILHELKQDSSER